MAIVGCTVATVVTATAVASAVAQRSPFPSVRHAVAHPDVSACTQHWFTQRLDHLTPVGGDLTFEQRFFVCKEHLLQPASPLLFYCGNEADVELYVNATGIMWEHAEALGAALVFAEHRYFGKSQPPRTQPTSGLPTAALLGNDLRWLSSEQALADYAALLHHLRFLGGQRRAVVAFGGSYGGMLAAWLRMKYPAAVDGAVAASAPILSFLGLHPPYDTASFGKTVTFDASKAGGASDLCRAHVRAAWDALFRLGSTAQGRGALGMRVSLCPSSQLTSNASVVAFAYWLQSSMDFMAMGSFPYESSYMLNGDGTLPPFPLREMCRRVVAHVQRELPVAVAAHGGRGGGAPSDLELVAALAAGAGVFYNYTGSPAASKGCFDLHITGNNETTRDGLLWDYLYCTDMLQPASRDGLADMFFPQPFDLQEAVRGCRSRWHAEPRPLWPALNYGGWGALSTASNIAFTNGALDPWKGGGVLHNVSASVRSFVIPGVGHHVDLFFSTPRDPPALVATRKAVVGIVSGWLRAADGAGS